MNKLIFAAFLATAFLATDAHAARDPLPAGVAPTVCADFVAGPVVVENGIPERRAWTCVDLQGGGIAIFAH